MTDKIYPPMLIHSNVEITEVDWIKLQEAGHTHFDPSHRRNIKDIIDKYMAAVTPFNRGATPASIRRKLTNIESKAKAISDEIHNLLNSEMDDYHNDFYRQFSDDKLAESEEYKSQSAYCASRYLIEKNSYFVTAHPLCR
jgi:hypothetical protein